MKENINTQGPDGSTAYFTDVEILNGRIQRLDKEVSILKRRMDATAFSVTILIVVALILTLAGCGSDPKGEPVNLNGHWSQVKNDIAETELAATVTDGRIEVTLKIADISGPYWTGTFVNGLASDPTSFESDLDTQAIKYEKMSKTKKFLYSNGAISFEFGAMGKKTIVYLEKD